MPDDLSRENLKELAEATDRMLEGVDLGANFYRGPRPVVWASQAGSGVETPAAGAEVSSPPLGDPVVRPLDWYERMHERLKGVSFGPMWRFMPKHEE